jgi:hypothetical protein
MYTSAECRAQAEEKLAQAEHDNQHRNRLITTAEAWLFLASQLRGIERSFVPKRRSRRTDYRKETMMTKKEVLLLKRCARAQFWPASYLKRGSRVDRALVAGGYLKIVQTDGHRFVRITDKGREALAAAEIQ